MFKTVEMSIFSYLPIDRNAQIRTDLTQVNESLHNADSRVLIWYQGKLITRKDKSLYFLFEEIKGLEKQLSEPVYLGCHESLNYFAYQLNQWHSNFNGLELITLRNASLSFEGYHLGLLYYSQGMLNWHLNHSFCSNCGSSTHITHSGHERKCNNPQCNRSHYPKIDPAVIFSIINNTGPESKILLARQSSWDKNRHSVIAGFVEPGETLVDTVKREASEETGLMVRNVKYVDSQPWPFPGQIMMGFSCETDQWNINLMDNELESASWFSAREIEPKVNSGELKMPFRASISWHLINCWFTHQTGYSLNLEKSVGREKDA